MKFFILNIGDRHVRKIDMTDFPFWRIQDGFVAFQPHPEKGELVTIDYWDSIADGLSARYPGSFPFRHLQAYMDEIVLISEQDIVDAFRTILLRAKQIGEPAGVVAPAGFLSGKIDTGLKTVAVLTGGNISAEMAEKMLAMSA